MVPPESDPLENEESDSSDLENDAAAKKGSSVEKDVAFQGEVDEMLNSIDVGDSGEGEPNRSEDSNDKGDIQDDEAKEPLTTSADDLLVKAGSILNGGDTELPEIEPETDAEADSTDAEADGLTSMPDPQSLMNETDESADSEPEAVETEDDELIAMPDPQTLMEEAGASVEDSEPKRPANIADGGGDLPPPPPAPVALEEEEIEKELSAEEESAPEAVESPIEEKSSEAEAPTPAENGESSAEEQVLPTADDEEVEAPVANADDPVEEKTGEGEASEEVKASEGSENAEDDDLLLDEEDSFLMDDDDDNDLLVSIQDDTELEIAGNGGNPSEASNDKADESQKSSRITILNTAIQSLPFAASLAILGFGLIAWTFKNEMLEWVSHGDTQGSSIGRSIAKATSDVFDSLGPDSPYKMVWMESGVKRVSDLELLVETQIGAELEVDLYQAVDESILYSKLPFDEDQLNEATDTLEMIGRDDIASPPKGWNRLYKHSASKGEAFPFSVSYRLLKSSEDSDWEISGMRMKEGEHGFAWSRGRPKAFFGANALDVSSNRFSVSFRAFEKAGMAFLRKAAIAENEHAAMLAKADEQAQEERQDLIMALSQGAYFKGMVIAGDEGADAREVSLIITETRNEGEIVKGVLRLEKEELSTKHFTGFFDVVESDQGIQGRLDLTTIAFAGQTPLGGTPTFFNPGTVSRITLQTDGYRMEGDADEISLRLIRSL